MRLLLEICLDRDRTAVDIVDDQHLSEWNGLTSDKAGPKVHRSGAELDAGLTSSTKEKEIVFWATHDLQLELVALEMVLSNW